MRQTKRTESNYFLNFFPMNIGDPSRTANSIATESELVKKQTHLEALLEASLHNEKRLAALAEFSCSILIKIRGCSIPQDGVPRAEKN